MPSAEPLYEWPVWESTLGAFGGAYDFEQAFRSLADQLGRWAEDVLANDTPIEMRDRGDATRIRCAFRDGSLVEQLQQSVVEEVRLDV